MDLSTQMRPEVRLLPYLLLTDCLTGLRVLTCLLTTPFLALPSLTCSLCILEALAEESVHLNLRLMRWRLMPELQTEVGDPTRSAPRPFALQPAACHPR